MTGFATPQAARLGAIGVSVLVVFFLLQLVHLYAVLAWENEKTKGLNYYGQPREQRDKFKRALYLHSIALSPILWLLGRMSHFAFSNVSFSYRGVAGPKGSCSEDSFRRAVQYVPAPHDVFVVTQMKCGTTWMQHIVYQVLTRGMGDLPGTGTSLYAVSPWLESGKSVPIDEAPLVGAERASRIIKTHLPVQLCPYSPDARYIYVARHPLSCFASCIDFVTTNVGAFRPAMDDFEAWFQSDELMWWGTWPSHVRGWWQWSQQHANVLFLCFEDIRGSLEAAARQVGEFLEIEKPDDGEIAQIVRKCSFDYMRVHGDAFEMNPPHVLQSRAAFFVSGKADRHKDVPEEVGQRILAWCKSQMAGSDFPLERFYPDVAEVNLPSPG